MDSAFDEANALKCELASEVLRSSGRLRLCVTGWSMLPTIWPGDTLEIEKTDCASVSAGDVVLFHRDRRLFVHRVVRYDAKAIATRGDALDALDETITDKELLGRVSLIVRDTKSIQPSASLSVRQRVLASMVRRSEVGARVVVGLHGLRQKKKIIEFVGVSCTG